MLVARLLEETNTDESLCKLRCGGEKIRIEKEKDYHQKEGNMMGQLNAM